MSCPKIGLHKLSVKMEYQTYYVSKNLYSTELKHKVCKEHINEGTRLRDLVRKYTYFQNPAFPQLVFIIDH